MARAAQLLHLTPGEGRLLVESSEVPGSGSCLQEHRRHSVVFPGNTGFSDVPSSLNAGYCHLHTGVSRLLMMGSVCIFMCLLPLFYNALERSDFEELLLKLKLAVSTPAEVDDRSLRTQSALCQLIRGLVWSHGQELSRPHLLLESLCAQDHLICDRTDHLLSLLWLSLTDKIA